MARLLHHLIDNFGRSKTMSFIAQVRSYLESGE